MTIRRPLVRIDGKTKALPVGDKLPPDCIDLETLPEAPSDNKTYGRKNAEWVEVPSGGGGVSVGKVIALSMIFGA